MPLKALDYESLNENVKKVQYAVRGELYLRASELQKEGKKVQIPLLFLVLFGNAVFLGFHPCKIALHVFLTAINLTYIWQQNRVLSGLIVPMTILSNFRAVSLFQFLVCRLFSQMLGILML